ncbi:MAG: glycosyltransferase family 39 protein [Candidatus Margulisbacteria bacterium]|jgi:4-amino-4-deoxy-L-arabinose transferase-like glycosyltransferase|nr:glycosyltransferase family 39 protein [Candidatus Margulisiibacteriota bacterium]
MNRRALFYILIAFLALSFLTLPRNPLQNDDAALYALAAKNAVVHNMWLAQFVTPGDPASFLDKPPLGIWLLAWPLKLFGVSELNVHIPNVLYYALLLGLLYWSLVKLAGRKLALNATLLAATSLCLVVYSRAPKLDVLLTLFVMTAHLSLYDYLKNNRPSSLVPFTLSLAAGFLVKSGFGLLLPALTGLFLLLFNPPARKKLLALLVTPACRQARRYSLLNAVLFLALVGGVLALQRIPLGGQFIPYLKAITIESKYNTSYTGFGFYPSVFGFLLITIFPWTPLFFSTLKLRWQKANLNTFCNIWFWSNLLFLLFFYRQNDLRTFTVLVPPLAILAGIRLARLSWKPATERRGFRLEVAWSLFFLIIFCLILITGITKPVNQDGFSLADVIFPFALFTVALVPLTLYFWRPQAGKFVLTYGLIVTAYAVLFYNTKPIADAFNPDVSWPTLIKAEEAQGRKFYIYRPPDRKLFYSPDLFWVDFMAGPADRYFWEQSELQRELAKGKAVLLSDTESWQKLGLKAGKALAQDSYSSLVKF